MRTGMQSGNRCKHTAPSLAPAFSPLEPPKADFNPRALVCTRDPGVCTRTCVYVCVCVRPLGVPVRPSFPRRLDSLWQNSATRLSTGRRFHARTRSSAPLAERAAREFRVASLINPLGGAIRLDFPGPPPRKIPPRGKLSRARARPPFVRIRAGVRRSLALNVGAVAKRGNITRAQLAV